MYGSKHYSLRKYLCTTLPRRHAPSGGMLTIGAAVGGSGAFTRSSGLPRLLTGGLHYKMVRFFVYTTSLLNTYTSQRANRFPQVHRPTRVGQSFPTFFAHRRAIRRFVSLRSIRWAGLSWGGVDSNRSPAGPRRPFRGWSIRLQPWCAPWCQPHLPPAHAWGASRRRGLEPLTSGATPPSPGGPRGGQAWGGGGGRVARGKCHCLSAASTVAVGYGPILGCGCLGALAGRGGDWCLGRALVPAIHLLSWARRGSPRAVVGASVAPPLAQGARCCVR